MFVCVCEVYLFILKIKFSYLPLDGVLIGKKNLIHTHTRGECVPG
jgi:hypothetical protein